MPGCGCKRDGPGGDDARGKASSCGVREPALAGAFPNTRGGRGRCMGREAAMAVLPCTSLNNGALILWQSGFPPQAFPVADFLTPIPSGCLLTANSSTLPSLLSKPHVPAPSPHLHWRHTSQPGACSRAVARTMCVSLTLSCLPQTSCCTLFR